MIFAILCIVIIGVAVAAFFAQRYIKKEQKEAREQIERLEGAYAFKTKILYALLQTNNNSQYKMTLMEDLSIEIEMMRICLEQLANEQLITEAPHSITLTPFGVQYAKIYSQQEKAKLDEDQAKLNAEKEK